MKTIKTLGLVGMAAMALLTFLGADSASATILCKTNTSTTLCPESYGSGQGVEASLSGTNILETLGGTVIETCTGGTLGGSVTNVGGAGAAAEATLTEMSWSGCTKTTDAIAAGNLKFHRIEGTDNATLTAGGTEWTVNTIFGDCIYSYGKPGDLGTVTGGSPATITVNTLLVKTGGVETCPKETRWTASYTFTAPTPLYFAEG